MRVRATARTYSTMVQYCLEGRGSASFKYCILIIEY